MAVIFLSSNLLPVTLIFSQFTTTIKSPLSICGGKVEGLYFAAKTIGYLAGHAPKNLIPGVHQIPFAVNFPFFQGRMFSLKWLPRPCWQWRIAGIMLRLRRTGKPLWKMKSTNNAVKSAFNPNCNICQALGKGFGFHNCCLSQQERLQRF